MTQPTVGEVRRPALVTRTGLSIVGLVLLAVGFSMLLRSHLGMDPWFAVNQGVAAHLGITNGQAALVIGITMCFIAFVVREPPGPVTAFLLLGQGLLIDLVLPHVPTPTAPGSRSAFLAAGLVVLSFGGALLIASRLGAAPYDLIHLGITRRSGRSYTAVRLALEVIGLALGWILGGEMGVGVVIVGIAIGPLLRGWLRLLRYPVTAAVPIVEVDPEAMG